MGKRECNLQRLSSVTVEMKTTNVPQCVGFIMDGNRRWAKSRFLPALAGHKQGYEVLKEMVEVALLEEIPHIVCYAFSTENWRRSEEEVAGIFSLLKDASHEYLAKDIAKQKQVAFQFVGDRSILDDKVVSAIDKVEKLGLETKPTLTVTVLLSYGGRAEIVAAVNRAVEAGKRLNEVDFASLLWTAAIPDPDLVIRTGGEKRLSNFLPWQTTYSELFFTDTYWPAFTKDEFRAILAEYSKREKRMGS